MKDLGILLSKQRLDSYQNLQEHFENLRFIGILAPKVCLLEICIRNVINTSLIQKLGIDWIENEAKAEYKGKNLTNHQLVSRQNLGFWCEIAKREEISILSLNKKFIFKKYSEFNKDSFKIGNKTYRLRDTHKAEMILNCIHTIRNRCFHCENLLKTRQIIYKSKNAKAPRITTFVEFHNRKIFFGVMPDRIEEFLDDCLELFHRDLRDLIKVRQGRTNE